MEKNNPYTDKSNRWSSHYQISRMLEGLPKGSRILDVGTGSGTIARINKSKGYQFWGIEPNIEWLDSSRDLYSGVFAGDLEQAPDEFLMNHDAVICGDVLEHLLEPETQLHRIVKLQPDSCLFIISVPNIANIWIRINLLFGRFNYSDRGILDSTHLHFYTKKSFLQFLQKSDLQVIKLLATPIPLDLLTTFFITHPLGKMLFEILNQLTGWWPTLFGYQWLAKTKKSESQSN